ncbi:PAS domain-containing protein [Pontibacillus salicampi]|uniref:PAS domain-containing protein n=1 Tax=Pontibacillus salicampi TaxID=1449801 RepID=UPI003670B5D6
MINLATSEKVLDGLSVGVLAIDLEYRVTTINDAAIELLQVRKEDIMGRSVYETFSDAPEDVRYVERTIDTQEEIYLEAIPYMWGGYHKYFSIRTKLLRERNDVIGAMVEFYDVTKAEEQHKELINRMEDMAVNVIPLTNSIALLPLQPIIDEVEFHYILDKGIKNVARMKVNNLIIDFSSIATVDYAFIDKVKTFIKSLELLGIKVRISGVRPIVALEWQKRSEPLPHTEFFPSLQAALNRLIPEIQ